MVSRAVRTFGPAALLLFAALVVLVLFWLGSAGVSHPRGGGCNYVPLVNGQPAYQCPTPPP